MRVPLVCWLARLLMSLRPPSDRVLFRDDDLGSKSNDLKYAGESEDIRKISR